MGLLQKLRDNIQERIFLKAVDYAFQRLSSEHLGKRLNEMMDDRLGMTKSNYAQQQLADFLRQIATEIEA